MYTLAHGAQGDRANSILSFSALYKLVWLSWIPLSAVGTLVWLFFFFGLDVLMDAMDASISSQISFVMICTLLSTAAGALVSLATRYCFLLTRQRCHFFYSCIRAVVLSLWHIPLSLGFIYLVGGGFRGMHDMPALLITSPMFFFVPSIVLVALVEQKLSQSSSRSRAQDQGECIKNTIGV